MTRTDGPIISGTRLTIDPFRVLGTNPIERRRAYGRWWHGAAPRETCDVLRVALAAAPQLPSLAAAAARTALQLLGAPAGVACSECAVARRSAALAGAVAPHAGAFASLGADAGPALVRSLFNGLVDVTAVPPAARAHIARAVQALYEAHGVGVAHSWAEAALADARFARHDAAPPTRAALSAALADSASRSEWVAFTAALAAMDAHLR